MEYYRTAGQQDLISTGPHRELDSRELAAGAWSTYFASIAPLRDRVLARVAVASGDADPHDWGDGAQHDRPRPLRSISYDPRLDLLELAVGSGGGADPMLRYFIAGPRRIDVARCDEVTSIVVDDASGARTRICLYRLPRLRAVPDPFATPSAGSSPHVREGEER
jgi:hypothetical protein